MTTIEQLEPEELAREKLAIDRLRAAISGEEFEWEVDGGSPFDDVKFLLGAYDRRTPALPSGEVEAVAWQFRQRSGVGSWPQSQAPWGDWCSIERDDYNRYLREPNNLIQVRPLFASSPTPQIAGGVRQNIAEYICHRFLCAPDSCDDCRPGSVALEHADTILALSRRSASTPPFSRWADTIEAASRAIGPTRSKELDALAAEVRAGGAAQAESDAALFNIADWLEQKGLVGSAKIVREAARSLDAAQAGLMPLATRLREAAHYCTELSALEDQCRDVADELERIADRP